MDGILRGFLKVLTYRYLKVKIFSTAVTGICSKSHVSASHGYSLPHNETMEASSSHGEVILAVLVLPQSLHTVATTLRHGFLCSPTSRCKLTANSPNTCPRIRNPSVLFLMALYLSVYLHLSLSSANNPGYIVFFMHLVPRPLTNPMFVSVVSFGGIMRHTGITGQELLGLSCPLKCIWTTEPGWRCTYRNPTFGEVPHHEA